MDCSFWSANSGHDISKTRMLVHWIRGRVESEIGIRLELSDPIEIVIRTCLDICERGRWEREVDALLRDSGFWTTTTGHCRLLDLPTRTRPRSDEPSGANIVLRSNVCGSWLISWRSEVPIGVDARFSHLAKRRTPRTSSATFPVSHTQRPSSAQL